MSLLSDSRFPPVPWFQLPLALLPTLLRPYPRTSHLGGFSVRCSHCSKDCSSRAIDSTFCLCRFFTGPQLWANCGKYLLTDVGQVECECVLCFLLSHLPRKEKVIPAVLAPASAPRELQLGSSFALCSSSSLQRRVKALGRLLPTWKSPFPSAA